MSARMSLRRARIKQRRMKICLSTVSRYSAKVHRQSSIYYRRWFGASVYTAVVNCRRARGYWQ